MRWTWLLVLLSLGGTGPLTAQMPSGCLDLAEAGPWYRVDTLDIATTEALDDAVFSIPARIELIDSAFPIDRQANVLRVPENSQQTPHGMLFWKFDGEVLELRLSTGFSGVHAALRRDGSVWNGTVRTSVDYSPAQLHERRVTLAAADCASPPLIPASDDPPLPRTIELASGVMLEVGQPLPVGIETSPRPSGALTVVGEPSGIFVGATTIAVMVNRAAVADRIELHYPADFDHDRLVERIDSAFATQHRVSRTMVVEGMSMPRGASWRNRTTTVYVFPSSGSGPVRLILIDPRQLRY